MKLIASQPVSGLQQHASGRTQKQQKLRGILGSRVTQPVELGQGCSVARSARLVAQRVSVSASEASSTASTTTSDRARPGEKKGFVEEMRFVAMKLHTKEQAPKEGQAPAKNPMAKWEPTREGYLRFLVESKAVYDAMEGIMKDGSHPEFARFQSTGLERSAALAQDIEWMASQYGMAVPEVQADGPGSTYAKLVQGLAENDVPAFICHYYNVYFAHTAGGRMIGGKMSEMLLEGAHLEFYKYESDVKELLQVVRDSIDELASSWTREQKDHCLEETEKSFKYSGGLLQLIAGAPSH